VIIQSPPAEQTITVRDVDVNLTGGDTYPLTVYPEDTLEIAADGGVELTNGKTGERIVILARHGRWYSVRHRTITIPPTGSSCMSRPRARASSS
jgi:hypothetical protein